MMAKHGAGGRAGFRDRERAASGAAGSARLAGELAAADGPDAMAAALREGFERRPKARRKRARRSRTVYDPGAA